MRAAAALLTLAVLAGTAGERQALRMLLRPLCLLKHARLTPSRGTWAAPRAVTRALPTLPSPAAAALAHVEAAPATWSALADPAEADAAVGSALPPRALLRRLQLAADPDARPEVVGPDAGIEEATRRVGRNLQVFCCFTKKPPPPAGDQPPSP